MGLTSGRSTAGVLLLAGARRLLLRIEEPLLFTYVRYTLFRAAWLSHTVTYQFQHVSSHQHSGRGISEGVRLGLKSVAAL